MRASRAKALNEAAAAEDPADKAAHMSWVALMDEMIPVREKIVKEAAHRCPCCS